MAERIDGKAISAQIKDEVKSKVSELKNEGIEVCLAVIQVGNDPASSVYVGNKKKACEYCGIRSESHELPESTSEDELLELIGRLNADAAVDGILVQLPLPEHISEDKVIAAIDPAKDVDGFHPLNAGRLLLGLPAPAPCTPQGIVHLLAAAGIPTAGAHAVVIGRSRIVGRPLSVLLSQRGVDATVTLCHTKTRDLAACTRQADIVVVAAGRPHTLRRGMIKPGATVIDVGVNRLEDASLERGYRLVGDADYDELLETAGAITPVPGGVGPLTIAELMANTVDAALRRAGAGK
mgnify:CR=1 FL=1